MKFSHWIVGVLAFAPVLGAIAGSAVNTEPLGVDADVTASLPSSARIAVADARPRTAPRLPDHYDMQTPDGLVEVHELAIYGRNADRWRALQASEAQWESDYAAVEGRWDRSIADDATTLHYAQQPQVPAGRVEAMTEPQVPHYAALREQHVGEIAEGIYEISSIDAEPADPTPPTEPPLANARSIDVDAELASRR